MLSGLWAADAFSFEFSVKFMAGDEDKNQILPALPSKAAAYADKVLNKFIPSNMTHDL